MTPLRIRPRSPVPRSTARSRRATTPSFELILIFNAPCALKLEDEPDDGTPVFRCKRNGKDMNCSVVAAANDYAILNPSPSAKRLRAPISKDGRTIVFATPKKAFQFAVDLTSKPKRATLHVAGGATCDGLYFDPAAFDRFQEEVAAQKSTDDAPQVSSSSSSHSSSHAAPSKPKGAEHGRMCSKDKECASGSCQMENKTRGRCQ